MLRFLINQSNTPQLCIHPSSFIQINPLPCLHLRPVIRHSSLQWNQTTSYSSLQSHAKSINVFQVHEPVNTTLWQPGLKLASRSHLHWFDDQTVTSLIIMLIEGLSKTFIHNWNNRSHTHVSTQRDPCPETKRQFINFSTHLKPKQAICSVISPIIVNAHGIVHLFAHISSSQPTITLCHKEHLGSLTSFPTTKTKRNRPHSRSYDLWKHPLTIGAVIQIQLALHHHRTWHPPNSLSASWKRSTLQSDLSSK